MIVVIPILLFASGFLLFVVLPLPLWARALLLISDWVSAVVIGWMLWRRHR